MEILTIESFKNKIFNFEESQDWKFKGFRPAIIDFYADWCAPCHALNPILENIAEIYKNQIDIFKINTEHTPELAALFEVRGIPSLLFIPLNAETAMSSGVLQEIHFHKAIKELFNIEPIK